MESFRTSADEDWAEEVVPVDSAAVEHIAAEDAAVEHTAADTVAEEVFAAADRPPEFVAAADTVPLWVVDGADAYKQAKATIHTGSEATLAPSTAAATE